MITAPSRDLVAAALSQDRSDGATLEFASFGGFDGWSLMVRQPDGGDTLYLSSTRAPGEPRVFKTFEALRAEVDRMCKMVDRRAVVEVHWS